MSNTGGFPGSVTTSTTTKVTPLIWFDATYLNQKEGALKAAAVVSFPLGIKYAVTDKCFLLQVLDLVGFICASVGSCSSCGAVTFFNVVAMTGFWISLVLLALYLFHVIEKLHNVNWLLAVSQGWEIHLPKIYSFLEIVRYLHTCRYACFSCVNRNSVKCIFYNGNSCRILALTNSFLFVFNCFSKPPSNIPTRSLFIRESGVSSTLWPLSLS